MHPLFLIYYHFYCNGNNFIFKIKSGSEVGETGDSSPKYYFGCRQNRGNELSSFVSIDRKNLSVDPGFRCYCILPVKFECFFYKYINMNRTDDQYRENQEYQPGV